MPGTGAASSIVVDGPVHPDEQFTVRFSGRLTTIRGGYFWLRRGAKDVLLLRSDGNPEIPAGWVDPQHIVMLDDGLSGDTSKLILPPDLPLGDYQLCTANSVVDVCTTITVQMA